MTAKTAAKGEQNSAMAKSSAAPATQVSRLPWSFDDIGSFWLKDANGKCVLHFDAAADNCGLSHFTSPDAQFILKACNAHQALYEALSAAVSDVDSGDALHSLSQPTLLAARAALALADAAQEGEAKNG